MFNDNENSWGSLSKREKFYWVCENVLYYDLNEEGVDFNKSADLSNLAMKLLFPIFLKEFNIGNWD